MNIHDALKMKVELVELEAAYKSLKAEYRLPAVRRHLASKFRRLIGRLEQLTLPNDFRSVSRATHLMRRHLYLRCLEASEMLTAPTQTMRSYEETILKNIEDLFVPFEHFIGACRNYLEENKL